MNTWTPLWSSTLDSTLWEEPPHVRLMFLTMLMMRDPDHVVRSPLRVLSKKANLHSDKEECYRLAEDAIKVLASPDSRSNEFQEFGGRRIEAVEGGWKVLNGAKYLEEMKGLAARLRKTALQRQARQEARDRKNGQTNAVNQALPNSSRDQKPTEDPAMAPAPLAVTPQVPVSPDQRSAVDRQSGLPAQLQQTAMVARNQPESPVKPRRRGPVQGGVIHVTQAGMRLEREDSEVAPPSSVQPPYSQPVSGPVAPLPPQPFSSGQAGLPPLEESDYPI